MDNEKHVQSSDPEDDTQTTGLDDVIAHSAEDEEDAAGCGVQFNSRN